MALYTLADFHLALGAPKPMDIFGGRWMGYQEKLASSLAELKSEDTLVIPGDFCWAMDLEQARPDFAFLESFPGRKLFVKGNHDYWWSTVSKFTNFCQKYGFNNLNLLHNTCFFYEDLALCGTRGWFFEENKGGAQDEKIFRRELNRLETSLKAAGEHKKICFLHYPPCYRGYTCPEILELLSKYEVASCYYGHLHGDSHKLAIEGSFGATRFYLVASDYVNFKMVPISI